MDVIVEDEGFADGDKDEIDAVLQRIENGDTAGSWQGERPDVIRVRRRLTDGRSACEVLDIVARTGPREAPMVAKLGPIHELAGEWQAYQEHLSQASALFAPIRAATPAVLEPAARVDGEREAVVYDHAARFAGSPDRPPETLERLARQAVRQGGTALERVERAIAKLFDGVRNDLYDKHEINERETTAHGAWNLRLGVAAEIEVDQLDATPRALVLDDGDGKAKLLYPATLLKASVRHDGDIELGARVEIRGLRAEWWGERLMGLIKDRHLRLEVVSADSRSMRRVAAALEEGETFVVRGRLRSIRARAHRQRLLDGLPELEAADGELLVTGDGSGKAADPFDALSEILETRRRGRLTALVHGDLNPRNILVVGDQPVLIDFAFTRDKEPFFLDFTRLEGCLAREVLPEDLSWAEHLRLQRLLAAACRLGERGADRFAQRLAAARVELGVAFRIFWALRRAARDACPEICREHWLRDYMEQLFLFAHLSLKWPEPAPAALRAAAAMAGVAAESLSGTGLYRHWVAEELRSDGLEILNLAEPRDALAELAPMARALRRRRTDEDKPLVEAHSALRANFVRARFAEEAKGILADLEQDHDVYISLLAYIELRGKLHAGRKRRRLSYAEMLESDEALAESEQLRRAGEAQSEGKKDEREKDDVLRLLAKQPAITLIGDAGAGKSTVAREWQYRLAKSIVAPGEAAETPRLPVVIRAPDLRERIGEREKDDRASIASALDREAEFLDAGALHVTVDALNELPEEDKQRVAEWIVALRKVFPSTPVVACHRQYNYTPGLLPFPVVRLEKVEAEQARCYILDYLRENDVDEWLVLGERLAEILLDDPEHVQVRDLAQTPLFLWMLVERYRETGEAPQGRGRLFEDFSRWYLEERHHRKYGEAGSNQFNFEDKATFLGRIGYALVERGATDLAEDEVTEWLAEPVGPDLLDEIVAGEILLRGDGKLRFLHQSFQEYFAARHFLAHEACDSEAVREKVWTFGWHDTFAVLLGFAGEQPEVVEQVVEAALDVNPVLTARCLRMAETPVDGLLGRFVAAQEEVLRDAQERGYAHGRAAQALAEHGRGPSRAALLRVAADSAAPEAARLEILRILPGLPGQARFEPVREKVRDELKWLVVGIFDGEAPPEVQRAAIGAVVQAELRELSDYLSDCVQNGEWSLRKASWDACHKLGLELTPRRRKAFVQACEERLQETETELYAETVISRMNELNAERVEILEQIATPERLPLFLYRRFLFRIHRKVRAMIDQIIDRPGEPPDEARGAWDILREDGGIVAVERWWERLRTGSGLDALAAAHRLAALGKSLDSGPLRDLLTSEVDVARLDAVAELSGVTKNAGLVKPMEEHARELVEIIEGQAAVEVFTRLAVEISGLDATRGRRLRALAEIIFYTRGEDRTRPGCYPWRHLSSRNLLKSDDYNDLLTQGGDEGKAAIHELSSYAGASTRVASSVESVIEVTKGGLECFRKIAERENDSHWQERISRAALKLRDLKLLPRLLTWAGRPELSSSENTIYHSRFGRLRERFLAGVLRDIGYMARLLLDSDHPEDAADAVALLHDRAATLAEVEDRSIVVGCTTALGYLGEWEPILTHLGSGEPWMHEAAHNIFKYWVSKDLPERERAARWIARRLHNRRDLAPEVRSTLGKLLERLERQIGRHVVVEDSESL